MRHVVPLDERAGVGLTVSLRSGGEWIALDFESAAGRRDEHDLTVDQVDLLLAALAEVRAEAAAGR
jgi:hypothetical protein